MARSLNFVTANPATDAFSRRTRQREVSRRAALADESGRFELDRARQTAEREQASDRALSDVVRRRAEGRPSEVRGSGRGAIEVRPLPAPGTQPQRSIREEGASALANVGAGRQAFDLAAQASDQRAATQAARQSRDDEQFEAFANALSQDRPEVALTIAKRAGMKITPAFQTALNNSFFRREFARRWVRNKATFTDRRQLEKQTQRDVIEIMGQLQGAQGVPQARPSRNRITPDVGGNLVGQPFPDENNRLFLRDNAGNAVPVRGPGGQQITGRAPRSARDPFIVTPTQRANAINQRLEAMNQDFFDERTPEEKLRAATEEVDRLLSGGGGRNPAFGQTVPGAGTDALNAVNAGPVPTVVPPPIPGREAPQINLPAPAPRGVQPVPMNLNGLPDFGRLQQGVVYQTPRGPLMFTGNPQRPWVRPRQPTS